MRVTAVVAVAGAVAAVVVGVTDRADSVGKRSQDVIACVDAAEVFVDGDPA